MARILAITDKEKTAREIRNEQRSREIAAQGMVLLKNNGVLPLKPCTVALFGNGARGTFKGGTGSGDVNTRGVLNIEQGLEEVGFTIASKSWLDRAERERAAFYAELNKKREKAGKEDLVALIELFAALMITPPAPPITEEELPSGCDTAIYVIGRRSGEGFDRKAIRGDYLLSETEEADLRLLEKTYKKVIVLLNIGGVIDTEFLRHEAEIDAILLASQGGSGMGGAVADVLTGKVPPSGKLSTTWARSYFDYPASQTFSHRNGDEDDEYYSEGIYVGYRYFDTFQVEPAYPFGFGLAYTDFAVKTESVALEGGEASVTVLVTNSGTQYTGREVVQVYASAPDGKLEKPWQQLAAFAKTRELKPGESERLTLRFTLADLASYDEDRAAYILEAGKYILRVGTHSRSTHVAAVLELKEEKLIRQLKNHLTIDCEMKTLSRKGVKPYTYAAEQAEIAAAPILTICAEDIPCEAVAYSEEEQTLPVPDTEHVITLEEVRDGKYRLEELLAQLSVEELAELCVGSFRGTFDSAVPTDDRSFVCPGVAGYTSFTLAESRKIAAMALSDGPAGLRVNTEFSSDGQGHVLPGGSGFMLPELRELIEKKRADFEGEEVTHYQYATAIPIATLLAQTWDPETIEAAGQIVGEEMREFGVSLWLAPGMNIHRNPLCGRNFEYFSEDPMLSGLSAAAETRGVQKLGGIGVTIKHFAMNNQEDSRSFVNDHAHERTIREIYLRGFEIAVKKAQPMAIMTSYNLINGTHTANRRDLLTAIARDEWGFAGMVMTDWGTTGDGSDNGRKYPNSDPAACIRAGNDLIMPGGQYDVDRITAAVRGGELSLGALQVCARRILQTLLTTLVYE